jgi:hypothetical protein
MSQFGMGASLNSIAIKNRCAKLDRKWRCGAADVMHQSNKGSTIETAADCVTATL